MYRRALILTACLCMAGAAAAVPAATAPGSAVVVVSLAQPAPPDSGEADASVKPAVAEPAGHRPTPVQEIVAGVLTGSLAAVLMLKFLYGRRRRRDPR